ncbi:MAG: PEP-CTERM sorting domain-containing protein [Thermoguttaceae bacterium]
MRTHLVCGILSSFFLILGLIASPAFAEQIQVQITGLNFKYDGTDIFDSVAKAGGNANIAEADPLTTIDFFKDDAWVGSLTASDNIFADLLIDNVKNIPINGGPVSTGDGFAGFGFDLLQNNGSQTTPLLSLNINQLSLYYSGAGVYITVGGLADSLVAQNLPFDLTLSAQDQISFVISSSKLTNVTTSGNYLSTFNASGTGDINGTLESNPVPEPTSTAALAGLAAAGLLTSFLRRRRAAA